MSNFTKLRMVNNWGFIEYWNGNTKVNPGSFQVPFWVRFPDETVMEAGISSKKVIERVRDHSSEYNVESYEYSAIVEIHGLKIHIPLEKIEISV